MENVNSAMLTCRAELNGYDRGAAEHPQERFIPFYRWRATVTSAPIGGAKGKEGAGESHTNTWSGAHIFFSFFLLLFCGGGF